MKIEKKELQKQQVFSFSYAMLIDIKADNFCDFL